MIGSPKRKKEEQIDSEEEKVSILENILDC
jgi:hypothetical protein